MLKCSGNMTQAKTIDNLNNVRRDASRYFRNKKRGYLKAKIEELES